MAHEVVHAILPEEAHARGGLMHDTLGAALLVGRRAPLDRRCVAALVRELAAARDRTFAESAAFATAGP